MENARIRPAQIGDIPAITDIYRPAVLDGTASFELDPPDKAEMASRWHAITTEGFPYLVAEIGGKAQAYAYASAYRTRPAYRFTVEDSVYVAPSAQGRGLGRLLLAEVIKSCGEGGFRQMIAVIGDSGNQPSIRLHRSLGFQFIGTLHSAGWKHGKWLDVVLMQLALGKGDCAPPADGA